MGPLKPRLGYIPANCIFATAVDIELWWLEVKREDYQNLCAVYNSCAQCYTQPFYGCLDFVRDNPCEPVLEQTEDDTGRCTNNLDDCHPSRLNGAPTSAIPIFTHDALPYTTLPIYPGLGQAPNMLDCIPGDLISTAL